MLLIPGPVEVPKRVLNASAKIDNHRSHEFKEIVKEAADYMNKFADSTSTCITTGSGTLAVESMIYSFTRKGDAVLGVSFGEFGDRLLESLQRKGVNVVPLKKSKEDRLTLDEMKGVLDSHKELKSVFFVHNETGNGTSIHNMEELTKFCKASGLKVYVDAVSSFGAVPIYVNKWGIDAMATCSQKGIASVPGLGIVCLGKDQSENLSVDPDIPKYLDIGISMSFMKKNETPYTPATGAFRALREALQILDQEGLETRWKRHAWNANFLRENLKEQGFEIYGNSGNYSDTVIAFDPKMDPAKVIKSLEEKNITISKGMGELSTVIVRIGNLGIVSGNEIMRFLNAFFQISGSKRHIKQTELDKISQIDRELLA